MTIIQWSRANAKITRATILAVNIPALHNVWKIMPPQVITFLSARIILKAELYAAATKNIKQMVKLNINKWRASSLWLFLPIPHPNDTREVMADTPVHNA